MIVRISVRVVSRIFVRELGVIGSLFRFCFVSFPNGRDTASSEQWNEGIATIHIYFIYNVVYSYFSLHQIYILSCCSIFRRIISRSIPWYRCKSIDKHFVSSVFCKLKLNNYFVLKKFTRWFVNDFLYVPRDKSRNVLPGEFGLWNRRR